MAKKCLSPQAPGYQKCKHGDLSFPELIKGMIAKFLLETPSDKLDEELGNKLIYLKELITLHHNLNLKSFLKIKFRFLNGWENHSFEWTDWSRIDTFLKGCIQELFNRLSHAKPGGGGKCSNNTPPGGNGGGNSKSNSNIYGIPTLFLTENNLCLRFNKGNCDQKSDQAHIFDAKPSCSTSVQDARRRARVIRRTRTALRPARTVRMIPRVFGTTGVWRPPAQAILLSLCQQQPQFHTLPFGQHTTTQLSPMQQLLSRLSCLKKVVHLMSVN